MWVVGMIYCGWVKVVHFNVFIWSIRVFGILRDGLIPLSVVVCLMCGALGVDEKKKGGG